MTTQTPLQTAAWCTSECECIHFKAKAELWLVVGRTAPILAAYLAKRRVFHLNSIVPLSSEMVIAKQPTVNAFAFRQCGDFERNH